MISKNFEINGDNNIRCKIYCQDIHKLNKIVIFAHGFGGHKDNKAAERFAGAITAKEKSTGVIVFNWPCHGDDIKKRMVLSDCDKYLEAVINHVSDAFGVNEIFAYGTSFGGYLILKYITEHENPFKRIAFRCPAIHMYDVLTASVMKADDFHFLEKGKEAAVGFDRKILIGQSFLDDLKEADISKRDFLEYADDILILHGTKDEIIEFDSIKEFCDENVIELIAVEDADHRFSDPNILNWSNAKVMEFFATK